MADDRTVEYTMRLIDNVSTTKDNMINAEKQYQQAVVDTTETTEISGKSTKQATAAQAGLSTTADTATLALGSTVTAVNQVGNAEEQLTQTLRNQNSELIGLTTTERDSTIKKQVNYIAQITTVRALHSAMSLTTNAFRELNLVNEDGLKTMRQFGAVIDLVLAGYQGFKAVNQILEATKTITIAVSAVETYRHAINKPWMTIGMIALAGTGGYVAGSLSRPTSTVNNNQVINFTAPTTGSDQKQVTRSSLESWGGY